MAPCPTAPESAQASQSLSFILSPRGAPSGDFIGGFSERRFCSSLSGILIHSPKYLGWGGQRMSSPDVRGLGLGGWEKAL